jgi:collagenase-like PrtC family protease
MKKLSIPYTKDMKILDLLGDNLQYVKEIYFPLPSNIMASGRPYFESEIPEYAAKYDSEIKRAKDMGLDVSILLSKTIIDFDNGMVSLVMAIREIQRLKEAYNIDKVVVGNNTLLRIYGEQLKGIGVKVEMTVMTDIDCVDKVEQMVAMYPFIDSICLNSTFLFNLDDIKYLRQKFPNLELKLLVNHGCLINCMSFVSHHHYLSSVLIDPNIGINDLEKWRLFSNQNEILRTCKTCDHYFFSKGDDFNPIREMSYLRPEDLHLYDDVITLFKISGRERPAEHVVHMIKAFGERSLDGDMRTIIDLPYPIYYMDNKSFPEDFGEHRINCGHKCHKCNYCDSLKEAVIRPGKNTDDNIQQPVFDV